MLILVGAITKSALVPFHFWLPGAMAAPTPVSAYLHAAAMVKAGIYLVPAGPRLRRNAFLAAGGARPRAGDHARRRLPRAAPDRHQAHARLRHGQPAGFPDHGGGARQPDAALAGLAMLLAHGLFKATLFLVVGIIDHQSGTRDVSKLSGVFRSSRALPSWPRSAPRPWPVSRCWADLWPRNPSSKPLSTSAGGADAWGPGFSPAWSSAPSSPSPTAPALCGGPLPQAGR